MIRRPPRSTLSSSSAASDVYKRQYQRRVRESAMEEIDAKVVVIGNTGVGKTCIVLRYVQEKFFNHTASTIGASFMIRKLFIDDTRLTLQIWDTAGQERFRSMGPMYYRGAAAAILVFDITSEDSFKSLQQWIDELRSNSDENIILAIACNKCDLSAQRAVALKSAQDYAKSVGAIIHETSAKGNKGIEDLFVDIAKAIIAERGAHHRPKEPATVNLDEPVAPEDGAKAGCRC
eukprot:TRINITY_DN10451_c0_g1_i2.p1 TRINITY_DN10451_c0_g1~~TRINITY_DN10451_c0_g1_i2.p1  ORF type:complete len:233 (-),score=47.12 TRINITY_DN10451_c0_g1_i2:287-985(-)